MTGSPAGRHGTAVEIDGRRVELSSLDKVLWPRTGHSKRDLIDYYRRIGPTLLRYISGRPLTLGRFPGGVEEPGFAQTECRGRPEWLSVREIRLESGETRSFCVADDVASLVWIANQNAIELHTFAAAGPDLERPGGVVFDLDPGPGCGTVECARVALVLRELLDELDLECFAKTSGALGLHVLVPADAPGGYPETKRFARRIAERLATERRAEVTDSLDRSERTGRVLVDWTQNDRRRTLVAPYSLRATPRPLASTPLRWHEVESAVAREEPVAFTASDVLERVDEGADPWAPVPYLRQSLP
jgi:bifunctional non-homologous end joining protein LigD